MTKSKGPVVKKFSNLRNNVEQHLALHIFGKFDIKYFNSGSNSAVCFTKYLMSPSFMCSCGSKTFFGPETGRLLNLGS